MKRLLVCIATLACSAAAAPPDPEQFASGIQLVATTTRAVLELDVPEDVYVGVTRADLADLRVFNAQGTAVPHVLCTAASKLPGPPPRIVDTALKVFSLRATRTGDGDDVDVHVSASGDADVHVNVQADAGRAKPATDLSGYVIDADATDWPIRALRLRWQTADGASEVAVRVEASDDLDRWRSVVARTTLLRVDAAGATLERMRIPLPAARYRYLRLVRADAGAAPVVDRVIAETVQTAERQEAPFTWFEPAQVDGEEAYAYAAGRRAPVQIATIDLPRPNMAVHARLQSRDSTGAAWKTRWQGEVFAVSGDDGARRNADIRFDATADRLWRIAVTEGKESLGADRPTLRLGYRPDRLRFLAQGDGPFLLAYGSVRAEPAQRRNCDSLLGPLSAAELQKLIGAAEAGAPRTLGGADALTPPPVPLPWRQIVLWGVLVAAALLLLAMARSLLGRARH